MKKSEFWVIVILMLIAIVISIASIVIVNTKTSSSNGITGQVTGNVTASLDEMAAFTLSPAIVNFGNITLGGSESTGADPAPFGIVNDGTVKINMTITSTNPLFTGTSPTYQFKSNCSEAGCSTTVYEWTTFDQTAQNLVKSLDFNDTKDALEVGIQITVPLDESAGAKSDTLTFTAIQE